MQDTNHELVPSIWQLYIFLQMEEGKKIIQAIEENVSLYFCAYLRANNE